MQISVHGATAIRIESKFLDVCGRAITYTNEIVIESDEGEIRVVAFSKNAPIQPELVGRLAEEAA